MRQNVDGLTLLPSFTLPLSAVRADQRTSKVRKWPPPVPGVGGLKFEGSKVARGLEVQVHEVYHQKLKHQLDQLQPEVRHTLVNNIIDKLV